MAKCCDACGQELPEEPPAPDILDELRGLAAFVGNTHAGKVRLNPYRRAAMEIERLREAVAAHERVHNSKENDITTYRAEIFTLREALNRERQDRPTPGFRVLRRNYVANVDYVMRIEAVRPFASGYGFELEVN
jgi:hypothetical protein